jgi:hypothetical protein
MELMASSILTITPFLSPPLGYDATPITDGAWFSSMEAITVDTLLEPISMAVIILLAIFSVYVYFNYLF